MDIKVSFYDTFIVVKVRTDCTNPGSDSYKKLRSVLALTLRNAKNWSVHEIESLLKTRLDQAFNLVIASSRRS